MLDKDFVYIEGTVTVSSNGKLINAEMSPPDKETYVTGVARILRLSYRGTASAQGCGGLAVRSGRLVATVYFV